MRDRSNLPETYAVPPIGGTSAFAMDKIVRSKYFSYAVEVLEDRAIPDFRDGLIPVYRRVLYSMFKSGIHYNGRLRKKASVVGDVFHYHAHGEISIIDSMVSMAKARASIPLIDGSGNWGSFDNSKPGAMRYVECRLSEYSDKVLLDPYYMRVVGKVPTYDGSGEEPLYLPALLPNALLFGMSGGIAVGTTSMYPPFHPKGVKALTILALQNKSITPDICYKHLEMNYRWGGKIISSKEEMIEFYRTGRATLYFACNYKVDGKQIVISGIPPRWNYDNNIEKLQDHPEVTSVKQLSSKNKIEVVVNLKNTELKTYQKIEKILQSFLPARINITMRYIDKGNHVAESGAEFRETNIPNLLKNWAIWRVALERRAIGVHLVELRDEIHRFSLLRKAIDNIDAIVKILKSRDTRSSIENQLMNLLHINQEDAAYVFDQRLRRLAYLSSQEIDAKISELEKERIRMEHNLTDPRELVIKKTSKLFDLILK